MKKTAFCICENKDADQLRSYCAADQRLCFRYSDSTIPLLPKSEISSPEPSSVGLQTGLCRTWSEIPKTGFLITRLISPCPEDIKISSSSTELGMKCTLLIKTNMPIIVCDRCLENFVESSYSILIFVDSLNSILR